MKWNGICFQERSTLSKYVTKGHREIKSASCVLLFKERGYHVCGKQKNCTRNYSLSVFSQAPRFHTNQFSRATKEIKRVLRSGSLKLLSSCWDKWLGKEFRAPEQLEKCDNFNTSYWLSRGWQNCYFLVSVICAVLLLTISQVMVENDWGVKRLK